MIVLSSDALAQIVKFVLIIIELTAFLCARKELYSLFCFHKRIVPSSEPHKITLLFSPAIELIND